MIINIYQDSLCDISYNSCDNTLLINKKILHNLILKKYKLVININCILKKGKWAKKKKGSGFF